MTQSQCLRVATLNMFGVANDTFFIRIASAAREFEVHDPDIVFLQEIITPRQVHNVRGFMSRFTWFTCGRKGPLMRGGLMIGIKSSKLEVRPESDSFVPFSIQSTLDPRTWADAMITKGCLWVDAEVRASGDVVRICNIHTAGAYSAKVKKLIAHQCEEFCNEVRYSRQGTNLIAAGDFNCTPEDIALVFQAEGLREAFDYDPRVITVDNALNPLRQGLSARMFGRGRNRPNKRIDYVLWRGLPENVHAVSHVAFNTHVHMSGRRTLNSPVSDHYGIVTTFTYGAAN